MSSRSRPSATGRISATLLVAALLVGLGAAAAYALSRAEFVPLLGGRIPPVAYDAYRSASADAASITPSRDVGLTVLAGIGQVESKHGRMTEDAG